ncbi:MAG: glycosyltransferase family 39 protein [Myxococcales bacterium]|jgi:4-amino-4-deoxy-L-arabinose transferase-like glycosyltransferase|nr:glycosyltransferase family 39 protein [Myxococcales bacterium]
MSKRTKATQNTVALFSEERLPCPTAQPSALPDSNDSNDPNDSNRNQDEGSILAALLGPKVMRHPLIQRFLAIDPEKRMLGAVVSLAMLIFLPWLGAVGLWDCWEVHYGEVARAMVARHDPIIPYWENAYFFSKPPLTMWLQAFGIWLSDSLAQGNSHLGIYAEWAMRLPFALLMLLAVGLLTLAMGRVFNRRVGLLSGVALATSPLFFLLARQTVTDTPFVAMLTCGLSAFLIAEFSPVSRSARELAEGDPAKARAEGTVTFWWLLAYAFFGLATLAKGLLGFLLPGAILLAYLLVSWDWSLLKRARILPGLAIFAVIAAPWYLRLSLFDGKDDGSKTFVQRFFLHDHLNRVSRGVHTTTPNTTFTYFIEQLGYAVFPWIVLLPGACALLGRLSPRGRAAKNQASIFIALWALVAFLVFTLSATKFHHYCFPIVPPLALMAALYLDDLWRQGRVGLEKNALLILAGLVLFALVAHDLWKAPAHLIHMFVYKYDRAYPLEEVNPKRVFQVLFVTAGLGLAAAALVFRSRKTFICLITTLAIAFSLYGSWVHWKNLTFHWSQRDIFWAYYQNRKSDEPIAAYYMNWRGETFYSSNTIRQIKARDKFDEFLDQKGAVWILVEQSRYEKMSQLVEAKQRSIEIVDRSGNKFYLAKATPKNRG